MLECAVQGRLTQHDEKQCKSYSNDSNSLYKDDGHTPSYLSTHPLVDPMHKKKLKKGKKTTIHAAEVSSYAPDETTK